MRSKSFILFYFYFAIDIIVTVEYLYEHEQLNIIMYPIFLYLKHSFKDILILNTKPFTPVINPFPYL